MTAPSSTFELQRFIDDCRAAAGDVRRVADLMRAAVAQPEAVTAALQVAAAGKPGERVLCQDKDLTVLNVRIPAGFCSPPHNHTIWAVVGIYEGQEDNTFYRLVDGEVRMIERHEVRAPGVLTLDGSTIHAIANPLAQLSCGLHVYGGHLDDAPRSLWDPDTHQPAPFTRERAMQISRRLMAQRSA